MTTGAWCAIWPINTEAAPTHRHYFTDGDDPWHLLSSASLCEAEFGPTGLWAFGSSAVQISQAECAICRDVLDELERGTE